MTNIFIPYKKGGRNLYLKILMLSLFLIFGLCISDHRKRRENYLLFKKKYILLMKSSYVLPMGIYIYTIIKLKNIFIYDFIGLFLAITAVTILLKAKIDLGDYHVWTGYQNYETKLITNGIYSYLRHPIYLSIYLYTIAALFTIVPHSTWYLTLIFILLMSYILGFLYLAAIKEEKELSTQFGEKYKKYRQKTNLILPINIFD